MDFKAPAGTVTTVYGAFGPVSVVGPAVTTTQTYASGTNMGDIVFITAKGYAPHQWDDASVVAQISASSVVKGFGGNDVLNGSSGQDNIDGGDGDDLIFGWNAAFAPNRDQLSGGAGDDEIHAAITGLGGARRPIWTAGPAMMSRRSPTPGWA